MNKRRLSNDGAATLGAVVPIREFELGSRTDRLAVHQCIDDRSVH